MQLLVIELGLFTLNNQFAKIYIDKNNKYSKAILFLNLIKYILDKRQVSFFSQNLSFIKLKNNN